MAFLQSSMNKVWITSVITGVASLVAVAYTMVNFFTSTFGMPSTVLEVYFIVLKAQEIAPYGETVGLLIFTMLLIATPVFILIAVPILVSYITYFLLYGLYRL